MLFSNIKDILECGANLLSSIEDQMEIAEENEVPTVGISFVEMAEVMDLFSAELILTTVCIKRSIQSAWLMVLKAIIFFHPFYE